MLLSYRPAPPLALYVDRLWDCESYLVPHRCERVLPNGRCQLILNLADRQAIVVGIQSRHAIVNTAAVQLTMGVLFRPGGARAFFDEPLDRFFNACVPLDLVWGSAVLALCGRLSGTREAQSRLQILEAQLQSRAHRALPLHPAVQLALANFCRTPEVRGVSESARQAGISRRRLAQLFREQMGITPKLFCRLRRFQDVVRLAASNAPIDWADVALAGGYCDQAHMAHEFREFAGISPGGYIAAVRPHQNHVAMD